MAGKFVGGGIFSSRADGVAGVKIGHFEEKDPDELI
jgi:hypothetical protein